jgi:hypothetical protein
VLVVDRPLRELAEYRLSDGELIARTVLPEFAFANGLGYLDGEVVAFFTDGRTVSRRLSEFTERSVVPSAQEERADCGSLWCVYSAGSLDLRLVDKASWELVHLGEGWELAIRTDGAVVGIEADFARGARAVAFFDLVTRREQQLQGWSPIGPRIDERVVSWRGPLFLKYATSSRTFFAVIGHGGMRVVGSVPYGRLSECAGTNYLVACRVDPQHLKVWRPS